jgi:hypothetical protein
LSALISGVRSTVLAGKVWMNSLMPAFAASCCQYCVSTMLVSRRSWRMPSDLMPFCLRYLITASMSTAIDPALEKKPLHFTLASNSQALLPSPNPQERILACEMSGCKAPAIVLNDPGKMNVGFGLDARYLSSTVAEVTGLPLSLSTT